MAFNPMKCLISIRCGLPFPISCSPVVFLKQLSHTFDFRLCQRPKRYFSTSWNAKEKAQVYGPTPLEYSPMTLLPDFSYVDGRPVPLSYSKQQKAKFQEKLCQRIIELSHELDVGLEHYKIKEEKKIENRRNILNRKLKPKGAALLKKQESQEPI